MRTNWELYSCNASKIKGGGGGAVAQLFITFYLFFVSYMKGMHKCTDFVRELYVCEQKCNVFLLVFISVDLTLYPSCICDGGGVFAACELR